jgi:hypothetical protein
MKSRTLDSPKATNFSLNHIPAQCSLQHDNIGDTQCLPGTQVNSPVPFFKDLYVTCSSITNKYILIPCGVTLPDSKSLFPSLYLRFRAYARRVHCAWGRDPVTRVSCATLSLTKNRKSVAIIEL